MKKILIGLVLLFGFVFGNNVCAYTSSEGSKIIEDVKNSLKGSKYTFKDNEGSSSKASYHIFYNGKMVGYIYATNNGISMGDGWQENGEVGTFFTKKDFKKEDILKYFYKANKNWVITGVKSNNFKILNKKLSYNKNTKNFRMYFEVSTSKKGNYLLEYYYKIKYPNGGGGESGKKFFLNDINNKIYFGDILNGDNGNNTIFGYKIDIFECTSGIEGNNCLGKNKVYSENIDNLKISTKENFNIIEKEKSKRLVLFKKYVDSRKKISSNTKLKKYPKRIEMIVGFYDFDKLKKIKEKILLGKTKIKGKKGEKYILINDLLIYIENYINYYLEIHEEGKIVKKYDNVKIKYLLKTLKGVELTSYTTNGSYDKDILGMKLGESRTFRHKGKEYGSFAEKYNEIFVTKTILYIVRKK